jgi:carboxyl-terminal processing protease
MSSRRRTPLLVALAVALPVLLVVGIWLGGHPEDLPGFARKALVANQDTRVVDEAIARIASDYYRKVPKGRLANASIEGAVASLGDRFSHYLTPREFREFNAPPSFTGIGVSVVPDKRGLRVARVYDDSPAARAKLTQGDVVVSANGRKLAGLSADAAVALVKGPPGTDVRLGIVRRRDGHAATRTITLTRATISQPVVASELRTVDGIKLGVVALAMFSPGAHADVRQAVERQLKAGARGIVLDLRSNGGGLVEEARLIASLFVKHGTIVSTRGRTQPSETLKATGDAVSPTVPMVVLVDGNSASASEIVTAALQDHRRATVIGTHTFGKGVFQQEEPLSNGGALDITVGEYFTPNGRNLGGGGVKQGAGIKPEVVLARDVVDTKRGLNAALQTLVAKVQ